MASSCKIFSFAMGIVLLELLVSTNSQTTIGEKYYRAITTQKVNWYRAYQICTALGMQLASIETESDQTSLRQFLFDNSILSNNYWLAGNNLADRGEYVWVSSGGKFSYIKWAPSQPGTLANRCVRTNSDFDWVSDGCNNANYFICSKPLVSSCGAYGGCTNNYNYIW